MTMIIMRDDWELSKFKSILENSTIELMLVDNIPDGIRTLPCIVDDKLIVKATGRKECYTYLESN